jgi:hypothetical protein
VNTTGGLSSSVQLHRVSSFLTYKTLDVQCSPRLRTGLRDSVRYQCEHGETKVHMSARIIHMKRASTELSLLLISQMPLYILISFKACNI